MRFSAELCAQHEVPRQSPEVRLRSHKGSGHSWHNVNVLLTRRLFFLDAADLKSMIREEMERGRLQSKEPGDTKWLLDDATQRIEQLERMLGLASTT